MGSLHLFDIITIAVYFLVVIGFGIWVLSIFERKFRIQNSNLILLKRARLKTEAQWMDFS
jgi:hypothetical protein